MLSKKTSTAGDCRHESGDERALESDPDPNEEVEDKGERETKGTVARDDMSEASIIQLLNLEPDPLTDNFFHDLTGTTTDGQQPNIPIRP